MCFDGGNCFYFFSVVYYVVFEFEIGKVVVFGGGFG